MLVWVLRHQPATEEGTHQKRERARETGETGEREKPREDRGREMVRERGGARRWLDEVARHAMAEGLGSY